MNDLTAQKCVPCEGGTRPLEVDKVKALAAQVPEWKVSDDFKKITRRFEFKGFYKTMAFINAIAWIANRDMHHPDFSAGYNYCTVDLTTHAIDGLSENDFIVAAKIDALIDD